MITQVSNREDLIHIQDLIQKLIDENEIEGLRVLQLRLFKNSIILDYELDGEEDEVRITGVIDSLAEEIAYMLFVKICVKEDITFNDGLLDDDSIELIKQLSSIEEG